MSCVWGSSQTTNKQARWTILISLVIILAAMRAYGQDSTLKVTTTDGTRLTAQCHSDPVNKVSSCVVADTTVSDDWNDLKELRKVNKESADWCKVHGLKKNTQPCREAYQTKEAK